MGGTISALGTYLSNPSSRKRKHPRDTITSDAEDMDRLIDVAMHTPKRKRMESTVQYIYQALFIEGRDSDVTVVALGEHYRLHKVYLSQSAYFASMFGGAWRESTEALVHIDVVDPVITQKAIRTVLGALYSDEVELEPTSIVSVLAAATMLQLTALQDRCQEVMAETVNAKTALRYHEAACSYTGTEEDSGNKLRTVCERWFLVNLMTWYAADRRRLRHLPQTLLEHLVAHADLCVLKTEISLYVLLTHWLYLQVKHLARNRDAATGQEEQDDDGDKDELGGQVAHEYFAHLPGSEAFLEKAEGLRYRAVFRALRLQHLVSHHLDVELLQRDRVIPSIWLHKAIVNAWRSTLLVNENEEHGPHANEVTEQMFLQTAVRCGRVLPAKDRHIWRWTGFHYGLDLVVVADERGVAVKRNHRPEYEQLLSLQTVREIMVRVRAYSLNEQRQISRTFCSGLRCLTMSKSEDVALLTFPSDITFPLLISANILFITPAKEEQEQKKTLTVTSQSSTNQSDQSGGAVANVTSV